MVCNKLPKLGKSRIRPDKRRNCIIGYIHRLNPYFIGIFRFKMIKKKKEEELELEEFLMEELFDEFEEDKVYAAS